MIRLKARLLDLTRGHGLECMFGCRNPFWHGRNYPPAAVRNRLITERNTEE